MATKNTILLFLDRLAVLDKLDYEQSGKLFKAIYYYSVRREEELNALLDDGLTDILFSVFKSGLDLANEKYYALCEKRRAAGIRGSQVRWGKEPQEKSCGTVAEGVMANDGKCYQMPSNDSKQWQTMASVADTDTDTLTDTDTHTQIKKSSNDDMSAFADAAIDYDAIKDYWNMKTKGAMGRIVSIDGERRSMTRARIAKYGLDAFYKMIDMAAESEFMHGTTWANYSWCVRPNNFPKVLEGQYIGKTGTLTITTNNNGNKRIGSEADQRRADRDAIERMLQGR